MKRVMAAIVGAAWLCAVPVFAQDAKQAGDGKKLYGSKECDKCHIIAGKGNKIGPLDGVATKLKEPDIRKWFTDTLEMEKTLEKKPKVKMSSKTKQMALKPAEIDAIVAYMLTLTKK